jgi:hypothetical protein
VSGVLVFNAKTSKKWQRKHIPELSEISQDMKNHFGSKAELLSKRFSGTFDFQQMIA